MYVHEQPFSSGRRNMVDVRFWPGHWYKKVINSGRIRLYDVASRHEILTVLEDIELLLIRYNFVYNNATECFICAIRIFLYCD